MTIFRCSLQVQVTVQGCQSGRFAAKFYKFGRIPGCLAVRLFGWPFGFFGRFHARLIENLFRWPFSKIIFI